MNECFLYGNYLQVTILRITGIGQFSKVRPNINCNKNIIVDYARDSPHLYDHNTAILQQQIRRQN